MHWSYCEPNMAWQASWMAALPTSLTLLEGKAQEGSLSPGDNAVPQ
jgi:hypothetical protein